MYKLKKNGFIGQFLDAFWEFSCFANTICEVFWLVIVKLLLLAVIAFLGAALISPVLASIAVFIVTGYVTFALGLVSFISIMVGIIYLVGCFLFNVLESPDSEYWAETKECIAKAYESHKEKYCITVTFEE